jgi:hypothetical protein
MFDLKFGKCDRLSPFYNDGRPGETISCGTACLIRGDPTLLVRSQASGGSGTNAELSRTYFCHRIPPLRLKLLLFTLRKEV